MGLLIIMIRIMKNRTKHSSLTTIGEIPGGIAAQCLRGFLIRLRKSGQKLQNYWGPQRFPI